jgi:glucosaminylphosphatidylinositol acyltransferase
VRRRRNSDAGARADPSTNTTQHRVSMPVHRENDKTATVLFSYAVIYWMLFGITRYLHIGGPDVSRRLVRLRFSTLPIDVSIDEVGQVNLPYIAWVAAYNTTVLLCYLLLDLAFFPTPLSKSTYSPVSGLKVVRRPSNSDDNVSDSASESTPLTMPGPSPMPAPPLLEAINRNSLAVFLLVRFISPPSPF